MTDRETAYSVDVYKRQLYCGWTNHLEARVKAHNEGRGAKYTKGRGPVSLVYYEEFELSLIHI